MSSDEDHREKNILLAKSLNQVKMDLRSKKKDVISLQTQLRLEKQRNSKLESDQLAMLNRIDALKKQLEDTFLQNTFGYIDLSKQIDQLQHDSIQSAGETSIFGTTHPASSTMNSSKSTFLAKIKRLSSGSTDMSFDDLESSSDSSNNSTRTNGRLSLSFKTFEMGLNSTFVKNSSGESELNCTFSTTQEPANVSHDKAAVVLTNVLNDSNVTVRLGRKGRKSGQSKIKNILKRNHYLLQKENQTMTIDSDSSPPSNTFNLRRGCRSVKKIDYNETSFRRKK